MAAVTSAVIGIAVGGATAVKGFMDAKDAKDSASAAEKQAAEFMVDARRKAEKDMFEGLTIPMDAYEAEFENNLAVAQQQTEALQEGDERALAAGVGRVGAISGANAEATRIKMGQEISDLERTKADSRDAINQQLLEMDVSGAREQNQRMRDQQKARKEGVDRGIGGLTQMAGSINSMVGLYPGGGGDAGGVGELTTQPLKTFDTEFERPFGGGLAQPIIP